MKHKALLLIDLQNGFDDEAFWGGNRNNPDMEQNIQALLKVWRNANLPVVHVMHNSTSEGSLLMPGQPGNELKQYARPKGGEPLFGKNVNSGFIDTGLDEYLKKEGIKALVLVGLTTNHCVSTTARMAGNLGYDTTVVADATATFDRVGPDGKTHSATDIHDISLANIHEEFATIAHTKEILDEIRALAQ